ncbi:DUF262 domain-containing protein [Sphingobacterium sp.]|uniref:GmrSD restriction endonuclease domain-containing protein n=1 Tax=Sphingobacterium sp. TaxID=341027 RepID=UPI0028979D2C|nr:DUF262 domain-containing protein [Sphingobacterium sp.]
MENNKFTFKQLLSQKKVEIPILQRDYVQGNLNDKKATAIRLDFVEDLIVHLSQPNPTLMPLDFIYGKLVDDELSEEQERQEEHLESLLSTVSEYAEKNGFEIQRSFKRNNSFVSKNIFVPFDGQQRLTTLFLLHFLVYAKRNEDISFLRHFTYKTRVSSRDFLEALLSNSLEFRSNDIWEKSFIDYLKDRNWFYDFWKYDPTVMSMLVMMEAFRKKLMQFEDLDNVVEVVYNNLESKNALSFDFLDIDEHQLDDKLYVKMNASGKELTDFEKFKSWLIEYTENPKSGMGEFQIDWENNLDTKWYDLFWDADKHNTDMRLYQFINKLLGYSYFSDELTINKLEGKFDLKDKRFIYQQLSDSDSIPFRFYIEHNIVDKDRLYFIWYTLKMFCDDSNYSTFENCVRKVWNPTFINHWDEKESLKTFVINNLNNLNLFHQAFLFAVFHFIDCLNKSSTELNEDNFYGWLRLIRNLIYNSRIDDDIRFFDAIQSIKAFGNKCLDIRNNLQDEKFIDFFPERQRVEEFLKNQDYFTAWQEDLITAENHSYFYGQTGFLIELAKDEDIPNLDKFQYLYRQFAEIFTDEHLNSNFLIVRALLSISKEWLSIDGSNRRLLYLSDRANARDRDENWRRLFNDESKRHILIELADLYKDFGDLTSIIEIRKQNIFDWRRLFIEYPDELRYCKQGLINYLKEGDYIRLLGQSRLSHYHRELRTSILFNYFLKEKFSLKNENYGEVKSDEDCIIRFPIGENTIQIYFDHNELEFKFYRSVSDKREYISKTELQNLNSDLFQQIQNMELYLSRLLNQPQ